jgi:hypothetical protein
MIVRASHLINMTEGGEFFFFEVCNAVIAADPESSELSELIINKFGIKSNKLISTPLILVVSFDHNEVHEKTCNKLNATRSKDAHRDQNHPLPHS